MFINTFRKGAGKEYFREQLYTLLYYTWNKETIDKNSSR